jgi:hypothetical protein
VAQEAGADAHQVRFVYRHRSQEAVAEQVRPKRATILCGCVGLDQVPEGIFPHGLSHAINPQSSVQRIGAVEPDNLPHENRAMPSQELVQVWNEIPNYFPAQNSNLELTRDRFEATQ